MGQSYTVTLPSTELAEESRLSRFCPALVAGDRAGGGEVLRARSQLDSAS